MSPRGKRPSTRAHAGRQQALAAAERLDRAVVDRRARRGSRAGRRSRSCSPSPGWRRRGTRCSARPPRSRRSGCCSCPRAMIIAVPAAVAILPASSLVCMPPRDSSEPALPAIASISGVMRSTSGRKRASGSCAGGAGVEPVDVGEQHQQVGAHHGGDARGEPVVVAVADLGGRDRVVLVDDRDAPSLSSVAMVARALR